MVTHIDRLVGKKINRIFMNDQFLKFETDQGNVVYTVEGDCCSHSYFHDFTGVRKLFENGRVISAKSIPLELSEEEKKNVADWQDIQVYGFEIVTEHERFGPQTSVFAFRNSSNGYYGGSLEDAKDQEVLPEITDDVIEAYKVPEVPPAPKPIPPVATLGSAAAAVGSALNPFAANPSLAASQNRRCGMIITVDPMVPETQLPVFECDADNRVTTPANLVQARVGLIAEEVRVRAENFGRRSVWLEVRGLLIDLMGKRDAKHPDCVPWNEEGSGWSALEEDLKEVVQVKIEELMPKT